MKRAGSAIFGLLSRIAAAIGLEGTLLVVGTACLSVFSASLSPVAPFAVVGVMSILAGIGLAIPERRA